MNLKAQVAAEFFIYSSTFLIIVLSAYSVIFFIQNTEKMEKDSLYIRSFGENFAVYMNTAMLGQRGFNYTMNFEKKILGYPYKIQFKSADPGENNAFLLISWDKNNLSYIYQIGNITLHSEGSCISQFITSSSIYYELNTSLGMLNFYNNGENLTLSQGC